MPPARLRLATLLAPLVLAGCNGDGGTSPAAPDYLALRDGNRWVYRSTVVAPILEQHKAVDDTLPDGRAALRMDIRIWLPGSLGGGSGSHWLLRSPHEVAYARDTSMGGPGSQLRLRLPLRVGDQYPLGTPETYPPYYDRDGDGTNDALTVTSRVAEIAPDTVATPLGSFDTLRVTTEHRSLWKLSSDGSPLEDVNQVIEWFAPGVGLVRRYSDSGGPYEIELIGYRVGARRSETTPPQLHLTMPDAGAAAASAGTAVQAEFDEDLDVDSARLVLRDAGGNAVFGAQSAREHTVTFQPAAPLASGLYTATVEHAEDLVGNVAAPVSWSFTVP